MFDVLSEGRSVIEAGLLAPDRSKMQQVHDMTRRKAASWPSDQVDHLLQMSMFENCIYMKCMRSA